MLMTISLLISTVICVLSFKHVNNYLKIASKNRTYKKLGFKVYKPDAKDRKAKKNNDYAY